MPGDGRIAETVGTVVTPDQQIVVIAPQDREQEVATRLARIGFDHVVGYLPDPEAYFLGAPESVARASRLTVAAGRGRDRATHAQVVDIRNAGEVAAGMLPGRAAHPARRAGPRAGELARPAGRCSTAPAASAAASAPACCGRQGFTDVSDLLGGYGAWEHAHPRAS